MKAFLSGAPRPLRSLGQIRSVSVETDPWCVFPTGDGVPSSIFPDIHHRRSPAAAMLQPWLSRRPLAAWFFFHRTPVTGDHQQIYIVGSVTRVYARACMKFPVRRSRSPTVDSGFEV